MSYLVKELIHSFTFKLNNRSVKITRMSGLA